MRNACYAFTEVQMYEPVGWRGARLTLRNWFERFPCPSAYLVIQCCQKEAMPYAEQGSQSFTPMV